MAVGQDREKEAIKFLRKHFCFCLFFVMKEGELGSINCMANGLFIAIPAAHSMRSLKVWTKANEEDSQVLLFYKINKIKRSFSDLVGKLLWQL